MTPSLDGFLGRGLVFRMLPALAFFCGMLQAAPAPDFEREVLPVLYNHCFSCHSQKQPKPKGGLRLDSVKAIRAGDVLEPGKPEQSELFLRAVLPVTDRDVMPPLKGGAQPLTERSVLTTAERRSAPR
jgi:hypothetical protein